MPSGGALTYNAVAASRGYAASLPPHSGSTSGAACSMGAAGQQKSISCMGGSTGHSHTCGQVEVNVGSCGHGALACGSSAATTSCGARHL